MATKWSDILIDALIDTAVGRIKKIAIESARFLGVLASGFPIPGPDFDARITRALLNLADAFDAFNNFLLEVASRTAAQVPVPKEWDTRVIKGGVAARFALLAVADGVYGWSQYLDAPAKAGRTAYMLKHWRYNFERILQILARDEIAFVITTLRHAFRFSIFKAFTAALTVFDIALKTFGAIVFLVCMATLLDGLQNGFQKQFLSQTAPRTRVNLARRGSILRRLPGGVPP